MTRFHSLLWILCFAISTSTLSAAPKKLLVCTVTVGFRHSSIETAEKVLAQLVAKSADFQFDFVRQIEGQPTNQGKPPVRDPQTDTDESFAKKTADYSTSLSHFHQAKKVWDAKVAEHLAIHMSAEKLKQYDGYIFANTTGDLPLPDRDALINEIESGKAFIAMHAGGDTFGRFGRYVSMLGGIFDGHPWHEPVTVRVEDPAHPAGAAWKNSNFEITDEIYQYKEYKRDDKHVILSLDPSNESRVPKKNREGKAESFFDRGKRADGDYAVSWIRQQGKGRLFYTSLGHREEVWENPVYQDHIVGGIKWALGLLPGEVIPGRRAP
jgi:uncharacterized protein